MDLTFEIDRQKIGRVSLMRALRALGYRVSLASDTQLLFTAGESIWIYEMSLTDGIITKSPGAPWPNQNELWRAYAAQLVELGGKAAGWKLRQNGFTFHTRHVTISIGFDSDITIYTLANDRANQRFFAALAPHIKGGRQL